MITAISAYPPVVVAAPETKDEFCEALSNTLREIPFGDGLALIGDSNTRVGSDHTAWSNVLSPHGAGSINENGKHLLELCNSHGLCVASTFSLARRDPK